MITCSSPDSSTIAGPALFTPVGAYRTYMILRDNRPFLIVNGTPERAHQTFSRLHRGNTIAWDMVPY